MRLAQYLFGVRTQIPERKVKFKSHCSIQLKDRIEGKETISAENTCMYEMMQLITCLAENEQNNGYCTEETKRLRMCTQKAIRVKKAGKAGMNELTQSGKLSVKETNKLLKQHPNI